MFCFRDSACVNERDVRLISNKLTKEANAFDRHRHSGKFEKTARDRVRLGELENTLS